MAPDLKLVNFRLDQELIDGLELVKDRDGISLTEQVRRALQAWLREKDALKKTERPRASTRKRS